MGMDGYFLVCTNGPLTSLISGFLENLHTFGHRFIYILHIYTTNNHMCLILVKLNFVHIFNLLLQNAVLTHTEGYTTPISRKEASAI